MYDSTFTFLTSLHLRHTNPLRVISLFSYLPLSL